MFRKVGIRLRYDGRHEPEEDSVAREHTGILGDEGERAFHTFLFFCRNNTTLNVIPYRGSSKVKLAFELLWDWSLESRLHRRSQDGLRDKEASDG